MVDSEPVSDRKSSTRPERAASNNVQLLQRVVGAVVLLIAALAIGPMLIPGKEERGVITQTLEIPDKPKPQTFEIKTPETEKAFEEQRLQLGDNGEAGTAEQAQAGAGLIQRDAQTDTASIPANNNAQERPANKLPAQNPNKAQLTPAVKIKKPAPAFKPAWLLQIGNFSDRKNAQALEAQAAAEGFRVYSRTEKANGKQVNKVLIGPKLDKSRADALKLEVEQKLGIKSFLVDFQPSDRLVNGSR